MRRRNGAPVHNAVARVLQQLGQSNAVFAANFFHRKHGHLGVVATLVLAKPRHVHAQILHNPRERTYAVLFVRFGVNLLSIERL